MLPCCDAAIAPKAIDGGPAKILGDLKLGKCPTRRYMSSKKKINKLCGGST
jgi:hypothetical protein